MKIRKVIHLKISKDLTNFLVNLNSDHFYELGDESILVFLGLYIFV